MEMELRTAVETVCKTDSLAVASENTRTRNLRGGVTVSYVNSLENAVDALVENGFEAKAQNGSASVTIGGPERPFTAVLRISDETKQLLINCQLGVIGDFAEDQLAALALAALDMNTFIQPYAFAIISDTDTAGLDDETQWPLVLTDSMPLGDLSPAELVANMDSLIQALISSRSVLEIGLGK
jgi:hypothetical protein